ncbi:hypothetical protein Rs2_42794 [Raphanus sativus]|nr:hypothetical protein Rs2_42794 [Raphanus sativus]
MYNDTYFKLLVFVLFLFVNQFSWAESQTDGLPVETVFTFPGPLPTILPDEGGFGKGIIDLGGLEVAQVPINISTAQRVWSTYEGGRDNMGFSIFELTNNIPRNFFKLGFYAQPNNQKRFGSILVARSVSSISNLRPPEDFIEVGNTTSLNIKQDWPAYVWQPVCLDGYQAVGMFVTADPQKPLLTQEYTSCVRSEFTEQSEADALLWGIEGVSVFNLRPIIRGTQATGVYTGTFSFQGLSSTPLPPLFSLKNTKLNMSCMPSEAQTRVLFQTYSPLVYFHPEEDFLPSSVDWFFTNGALLYQKGNESNPVPIQPNGTNLPQGGSNDDLYWLDYPVDKTLKEKVKRGDLSSTKVYLHIKPMFGGTYTDIVVWIFCPFNGNANLKFLFIKKLPLGDIGEHIGDWEHVTLRISNFNGMLWRVYFAEHSKGTLVEACDLEYVDGENKPVVYSSLHGHAMFSKPGLVLQGDGNNGIRNDMERSDKVLDCGLGYEVIAGLSGVVEPPWVNYLRKWGPQVSYDIEKSLQGFAKILPWFLRKSFYKLTSKIPVEILGEEGPTGPKDKSNWTGDEGHS